MSKRRRKQPLKLSPLGELVVDIGTLAVMAIAFAPEITAALSALKPKKES